MKKGFTLVELAIVLVIIGLLIGGILAAQSMVNTAKTQQFVRRIQQFDIAITNFKTRYNTWPGDSTSWGCVVNNNTCDDGVVEDGIGRPYRASDNGTPYNAQVWGSEWAEFWVQLQQSGFVYGGGVTFIDGPIASNGLVIKGSSINAPPAEMFGDMIGIMPLSIGEQEFDLTSDWGKLFYMVCELGNDTPNSSNIFCGGGTGMGVPPLYALAIDQKIDDGQSRTGNMIAYDGNDGTCNSVYATNDGINHYTTGNYSDAAYGSASKGCYLYIKAVPALQ